MAITTKLNRWIEQHGGTRKMYVYFKSEPNLWRVGFYTPLDRWIPESDHGSPEEAADRVHYLNGGNVRDALQGRQMMDGALKDARGYLISADSKLDRGHEWAFAAATLSIGSALIAIAERLDALTTDDKETSRPAFRIDYGRE